MFFTHVKPTLVFKKNEKKQNYPNNMLENQNND